MKILIKPQTNNFILLIVYFEVFGEGKREMVKQNFIMNNHNK
jgi:hypothetical protein